MDPILDTGFLPAKLTSLNDFHVSGPMQSAFHMQHIILSAQWLYEAGIS
jgi:hypothetical protein